MKIFVLATLLMWLPAASALIPMPRDIQLGEGELTVDVQTAVIAPENLKTHAGVLTSALQKTTGYPHRWRTPQQVGRMTFKRAIRLGLADSEEEEYYQLKITPEGVTINGSDLAGLMHGVQTFVQMLPVAKDPINAPFPRVLIPSQTIEDWPETKRRIFHLDVSAHLFPTADLMGIIDWMSRHKLNELHLQLNGDNGWRMESLKFPKLHEVGSVRASTPPYGDPTGSDSTEYGGYYPQKNLKELVAYAEARSIDVVPCFSFATGASALIAAIPELGALPLQVATTWEDRTVSVKNDAATLEFFAQFFAEVATVFPSKYLRLEGEDGELHVALGQLLAQEKKELVQKSQITSTDFSVYSRPAEAELLLSSKLEAEKGLNTLRQVYEMKSGEISEATLRTRYVPNIDKLQYLVFPRLAAFAEASWTPAESRKYHSFLTRVQEFVPRYRLMGVQASDPYDPPSGETLAGTIVTSSLAGRDLHEPPMIFDGRRDSFFWSQAGLTKGDHLTLEFPWPISGDIAVATGRSGGAEEAAPGVLADGVLDLSSDGKEWDSAAEFFDGLATVTLPKGTRFVRIRASGAQEDSLVLHEVTLSEPLLTPKYEESREINLPVTKEKITLTFRANFENHPEMRDEISVIRRTFFKEWLPFATQLGVATFVDTPRTFAVKPGEPGELSDAEAREWLIKRLIPQIQHYPVSSPLWFATGMVSLLRGDLPKNPDREKCLEGGPETAAFFRWISEKFSEELLMSISQDIRSSRYQPKIWKTLTKLKLEDLSRQYREQE
jgi:hypothetical protein